MIIQVEIAVSLWWEGCLTGEEHEGTLAGLEMSYLFWIGFTGMYICKTSLSWTLQFHFKPQYNAYKSF